MCWSTTPAAWARTSRCRLRACSAPGPADHERVRQLRILEPGVQREAAGADHGVHARALVLLRLLGVDHLAPFEPEGLAQHAAVHRLRAQAREKAARHAL